MEQYNCHVKWNCAVPEDIHTPPPPPPHARDWNFLRGGEFCRAKKFIKEMYEA